MAQHKFTYTKQKGNRAYKPLNSNEFVTQITVFDISIKRDKIVLRTYKKGNEIITSIMAEIGDNASYHVAVGTATATISGNTWYWEVIDTTIQAIKNAGFEDNNKIFSKYRTSGKDSANLITGKYAEILALSIGIKQSDILIYDIGTMGSSIMTFERTF